MTTDIPDLDAVLAGLSADEWRDRIDGLGEEHGYYLPLGQDHAALFIDAGPRLLVTFEDVEELRARPDGRPRGFDMVETEGWSLLTILSEGRTWFRDDAVTWFFDRQVDDGFFEDFDQVLFHGTGIAGYAAAAYSVTAPASNVLLYHPVATQDPLIAGWDTRWPQARALDFTTRYGFAPDMLDAAAQAWVVFDPLSRVDAMHAALFRRPNVTLLRAPRARTRIEPLFELMEIVHPMLVAGMDGTLDTEEWGRLWGNRRRSVVYPRALLRTVQSRGRSDLAARICRFGMTGRDRAFYETKAMEMGLSDLLPA